MNDEVTVIDDQVAPIGDSGLLQMAQQAEERINAVIKIKQIALKVTNPRDWTDQGGNPYLQVSGSEKIANLFNISWRIDEPLFEEEPDGHFTYTYTGIFTVTGRSIQVTGSRSSKDPFFKKYDYVNGQKVEKPISAIDRRDVKMAAMTNLLGNGITRLLGIRNLTWEDLKAFANIEKDQIGKVTFKDRNSNKPPVTEPQKKTGTATGDPAKISLAQQKRFFAIAKGTGFSDDEIKAHLLTFGIEHTADILKSQYDDLCAWAAVEREPGAEG